MVNAIARQDKIDKGEKIINNEQFKILLIVYLQISFFVGTFVLLFAY
jgi:hypothetical protein